MEKNVELMEKKFFAMKENSQSVLCKFFNKCLLYMTYAKEWPYCSKKKWHSAITRISQYFLRQTMLNRNMKNIHKILEKTAECEPYEFAKHLFDSCFHPFWWQNSEICSNTTF